MAYEDNFDYTSNVKAAIRGDEEAFNRLYWQSYDLVYATCRSSVSDRSMTDDMVQETYIQVYHKLYQIKDPSKFNGWVCTVARNICYRENGSNKTKEKERRTTPIGGVHDDNMADERILYQMNRDEFNELANDDFVGQLLSDLNEEERRCILLYSEATKRKKLPKCWKFRSAPSRAANTTPSGKCGSRRRKSRRKRVTSCTVSRPRPFSARSASCAVSRRHLDFPHPRPQAHFRRNRKRIPPVPSEKLLLRQAQRRPAMLCFGAFLLSSSRSGSLQQLSLWPLRTVPKTPAL